MCWPTHRGFIGHEWTDGPDKQLADVAVPRYISGMSLATSLRCLPLVTGALLLASGLLLRPAR